MELEGKRVAVLAERDFEDLELWYPLLRLKEAGAEVVVVGMGESTYKGKHGVEVKVDATPREVSAVSLDGVVVPGGWAPDRLRRDPTVLSLVRDVFNRGKLVASICHGPSVLISARILQGRKVTGVIAVKDDIEFAGGTYIDAEVVVDGNLVTSRTPRDLPAFGREIVKALAAQGK